MLVTNSSVLVKNSSLSTPVELDEPACSFRLGTPLLPASAAPCSVGALEPVEEVLQDDTCVEIIVPLNESEAACSKIRHMSLAR